MQVVDAKMKQMECENRSLCMEGTVQSDRQVLNRVQFHEEAVVVVTSVNSKSVGYSITHVCLSM